jgi:hypothetical protein
LLRFRTAGAVWAAAATLRFLEGAISIQAGFSFVPTTAFCFYTVSLNRVQKKKKQTHRQEEKKKKTCPPVLSFFFYIRVSGFFFF